MKSGEMLVLRTEKVEDCKKALKTAAGTLLGSPLLFLVRTFTTVECCLGGPFAAAPR